MQRDHDQLAADLKIAVEALELIAYENCPWGDCGCKGLHRRADVALAKIQTSVEGDAKC